LKGGAEFVLLVMPTIPFEMRGEELTADMMEEYGAKLLQIDELKTTPFKG